MLVNHYNPPDSANRVLPQNVTGIALLNKNLLTSIFFTFPRAIATRSFVLARVVKIDQFVCYILCIHFLRVV